MNYTNIEIKTLHGEILGLIYYINDMPIKYRVCKPDNGKIKKSSSVINHSIHKSPHKKLFNQNGKQIKDAYMFSTTRLTSDMNRVRRWL